MAGVSFEENELGVREFLNSTILAIVLLGFLYFMLSESTSKRTISSSFNPAFNFPLNLILGIYV